MQTRPVGARNMGVASFPALRGFRIRTRQDPPPCWSTEFCANVNVSFLGDFGLDQFGSYQARCYQD